MMEKQRGFIYVFTGFGGGKTRSAFGTALRALANEERVLVIQFLKSPTSFNTGEVDICRKSFPQMDIYQYGFDKITMECNVDDGDKIEAQRAWSNLLSIKDNYDLIILDEVLPALNMKLLTQRQFFDFIKSKSSLLDIVLTGRMQDKVLRDKVWAVSDFYSDIYEKKHYFNRLCESCNVEYNYRDNFCPQCGKPLTGMVVARKGREY